MIPDEMKIKEYDNFIKEISAPKGFNNWKAYSIFGKFSYVLSKLNKAEAQRAELLEALEIMTDTFDDFVGDDDGKPFDFVAEARAAIANAKEQK